MNTLLRLITKHWKRFLLAAFGTAVAGGSVAVARKRAQTLNPVAELPVDTGPIVSEPTMMQRLRNAVPKRRPKKTSGSSSGGGTGSVAAKPSTTTARPTTQETFEEPTKRTPIPARPKSKDIADQAQRARDTAKESAQRSGFDGPDFGIGRQQP
jgi:hypothetical protein